MQPARVFAERFISLGRISHFIFPRASFLIVAAALFASGCSHHPYSPPPPAPTPEATQPSTTRPSPSHPSNPPPHGKPAIPGEYVEEGVASWYGDPFNGHRTSNGEVYD